MSNHDNSRLYSLGLYEKSMSGSLSLPEKLIETRAAGFDYLERSGCMRRFGGPDKEMRSISRADKLCRNNGVGMSVANDLAIVEAEGPLGPEAHTDLLCDIPPI